MALAGGMMEPGMGMGMAMGRALGMGSGSVLSQAEQTSMWNKVNNGTAGAGGGGVGGRGGFENRFYAVAKGRQTGIFWSWAECENGLVSCAVLSWDQQWLPLACR